MPPQRICSNPSGPAPARYAVWKIQHQRQGQLAPKLKVGAARVPLEVSDSDHIDDKRVELAGCLGPALPFANAGRGVEDGPDKVFR